MKDKNESYRGFTLKYVETQTFDLVVSIYDKTKMLNRIPWNMNKDEACRNAIQ